MLLKNGAAKKGLSFLCSIILGICCLFTSIAKAETSDATEKPIVSPVGNWLKINHKTKQPGAVIEITETADHMLEGKVTKIYDPEQNKTTCTDCPESFKNQPIVGMQVLWGLKQASDYTWTDGHILSPKRGKVYACNLTVSQDGQTLTVRLYSVSALLGYTETWYRT